jgi:hypothetical protein
MASFNIGAIIGISALITAGLLGLVGIHIWAEKKLKANQRRTRDQQPHTHSPAQPSITARIAITTTHNVLDDIELGPILPERPQKVMFANGEDTSETERDNQC